MSELIGLAGASLAGYAYLPQITHLIRERCSAGISRSAFTIWLLASVLMTIHAVLLPAVVFIALGAIQIGAIRTILIYSARYRGLVCPIHLGARPTTRLGRRCIRHPRAECGLDAPYRFAGYPLPGRQASHAAVRPEPMPRRRHPRAAL